MTARILWKSNEIQWDGSGNILWVPSGSDPDDCACCTPAGCSFCVGDGGPYSQIDFSLTISGLPASKDIYFSGLACGSPSNIYSVWKLRDLDKLNGTYNWSTSGPPDCLENAPTLDFTTTTSLEVRDHFFPTPTPCTGGTLLSTLNATHWRLVLSSNGFVATLLPALPALGQCRPLLRATDTVGPCYNTSASNNQVVKEGAESFAAITCDGSMFPTYSASCTITGIP